IPFFVVSTSAPLLQNWFFRSTHVASSDPYFLYASSNAGSLLALIAYPFVIEPRMGVASQSRFWFAAYVGLMIIFGLTVAPVREAQSRQLAASTNDRAYKKPIHWKARLYWVAASFVPSALMLAVTNHITANVGSVPFLWLFPLALYLLTFIFAFAGRHVSPTR